jgi:hypothetical protein
MEGLEEHREEEVPGKKVPHNMFVLWAATLLSSHCYVD